MKNKISIGTLATKLDRQTVTKLWFSFFSFEKIIQKFIVTFQTAFSMKDNLNSEDETKGSNLSHREWMGRY